MVWTWNQALVGALLWAGRMVWPPSTVLKLCWPGKSLVYTLIESTVLRYCITRSLDFHFHFSPGLIPVLVHMDGAEFYSNSEYYVWSLSSLLASGETEVGLVKHVETCNGFSINKNCVVWQVWDVKYPICIVPHMWMQDTNASDPVV